MPSEPSGSDISGFVDLSTSPTRPTQTQQNTHTDTQRYTEASSTFHFVFVDLHVYLPRSKLSLQGLSARTGYELVTI
ncbi:hypothetical protein ACN38_g6899 [Penicillium nordicum]|uniref:Uncharacterized protein n=1 Tax=Penicillium nordicum TaxID=229535 RepID=A0A0M8P2K1_9EURO|nr:hypothetical protein ACN38_g6899 [Penicillium nordicum]